MKKERPRLLVAEKNKKVYDIQDLEATGMKSGEYFRLDPSCLVKLPEDSELFLLPDRAPVCYDPAAGGFTALDGYYAVAAFLAPGYTSTYSASYTEGKKAGRLPLFSYTAVSFYRGSFYAAGVLVDREKRQKLSGMKLSAVRKGVGKLRKLFPENRLIRHLEKCALVYGCPAAKNFFLQRYEGPLPASPTCNAVCIGCISYQPGKGCSVTQPRIEFVPSAEEIAEAALFHIDNARDPVVSFGQGCEGEPLMAGSVLEGAVKLIRKRTRKGVINLNTNASKPDIISRLFDAGLDSIRVSMNSAREEHYSAYYRPRGYVFADVLRSIRRAKKKGGFVSINYLVMPGFTDSRQEVRSLLSLLDKINIDMVQWRNLNYDPMDYFRKLRVRVKREDMIGVDTLINKVSGEYPGVMKGYFNPSKGRIRRSRAAF